MDVRLPDGRILRNVPEGTTKAEIAAKMGIEMPEQPTGLSGVVARKAENIAESRAQTEAGMQPAALGAYRTGGEVLGGLAEGVEQMALKAVPYEGPLMAAQQLGSLAGKLPIPGDERNIGEFTSDLLGAGLQKASEFEEEHPVGVGTARATLGYASAIPGVSTAKRTAQSVTKPLSNAERMARQAERTKQLRKEGTAGYKEVRVSGDMVSPKDTVKLHKALSELKPGSAIQQRSWMESGAGKKVQDILSDLEVADPSFDDLLTLRTDLNSEIRAAYRSGKSAPAGQLEKVKNKLDDVMINPDSGAWQAANHKWAQQATLGDIDTMVAKASGRAQPANSLDTAINNYLNNPKKSGHLSDTEWQLLKDVTDNTKVQDLRKGAASGLVKYGTAALGAKLGVPGAGAGYLLGHYGSDFLKNAAMTSKLKKLDKFYDAIEGREFNVPEKQTFGQSSLGRLMEENPNILMKDIGKLPPREAQELLKKRKK